MNYRKFGVFIALFLSGFNTVYGNGPTMAKQFINHKDWSFVENKGQLADEKGEILTDIKYYGHQGGVYLYCKPGMISFVFTKVEKENGEVSEATGGNVETQCLRLNHASATAPLPKDAFNASLQRQSADLVLIGSNPSAEIIASDRQEYYENYYTENTGENGITNVHTYKTITYKSIYPNIDLVLHAKANGMKYEFVIYPGGKVSDIQIDWRGIENIKRFPSARAGKDSGIEYSCSLGKMTESAPYSFVLADPCVRPDCVRSDASYSKEGRTHGSAPDEIPSRFILKNNHISFKTGKYDKNQTLVIDPTLEWGTYFGGSGAEYEGNIATDSHGNVYISGYTSSSSGIATNGAYQTSYAGNFDMFLAKFNNNGIIQWATYSGGTGADIGDAVATDGFGNVYITGQTQGGSGITTSGTYQTPYTGGSNIFLAKFNDNGSRQWATYYGGNAGNGFGITTDRLGNVYITGVTSSNSGMATKGAYQTNYSDSNDAFLAKFNSAGAVQWATYFGGIGNDVGEAVATDNNGDVYLTGYTFSHSGIATIGAYQTSLIGSANAFLAKFNSVGAIQWATYYGNGGEDGCGVVTDHSGNVYFAGTTISKSGIATKGAFQTSYGGNGDAFLVKFNNIGIRQWATYFGGSGAEGPSSGIATDAFGNIYIAGSTQSKTGIATTGSYQTSFSGNQDGFLAEFNGNGAEIWATYHGGNSSENIDGIAIDFWGNIFIAGPTTSNSGIATGGSFQTSYGGGFYDAFLTKYGYHIPNNDAGIDSLISPNGRLCKGTSQVFILLKNYGLNDLDSVKIILSVNGKILTNYSWMGKLLTNDSIIVNLGNFAFLEGFDTVKSWIYNPNGTTDSFPGNDTATSIVYVSSLPTATAGPDTILCYDETYTMQGAGGITYLWTPAKYLSNDTIPTPKAELPNTQLYTLYVRNKYGCEDSANVLLTVKPRLQVKVGAVVSPVCYGSAVSLSAIGMGGDSAHYLFSWPNDSVKGNPVNLKIYQSGWHKVVLSDNCSGLPATDSVYIGVSPAPKADFTILNRKPYLPDTSFRFQNLSTNATKYLWTFGDSSPSNTAADPVHIYTDSGTYKITLVAYGDCSNDTGYGYIHIFGKYVNIYIPNAFSPNEDGINDVFDIKGLGFVDYNVTIYNRWGELLYASPRPSPGGEGEGWDGSFKNQPAPEGIYEYMVTVTDQFGIRHYFSGNVMLVR